ncbi:MAG: hypothetical protein GX102_07990 [Porphyromonadaceae bacterium]|jgi:hypothetical protein|nr:hypothetical protein [Porphyromonadaceae bacterium]
MNWLLLILWFIIGLILANGLRVWHIIESSKKKLKRSQNSDIGEKGFIKVANYRYLPFMPISYLAVWIACSFFYLNQINSEQIYVDALITGVVWWILVSISEMLFWVIANHKFQLTWKEMYKDSQPWSAISYYAVLISPLFIALIIK